MAVDAPIRGENREPAFEEALAEAYAESEHLARGRNAIRTWTRQDMMDAGWRWYLANQRAATVLEWRPIALLNKGLLDKYRVWHEGDFPTYGEVRREFGQWNLFWMACGLLPFHIDREFYNDAMRAVRRNRRLKDLL